jgi:methionine-rich copper-binding protein CopC
MTRPYIALAAALIFGTFSTAAFAHAQLRRAVPAVGSTVAGSPQEIRLQFSEAVEPRFSSVALTTQAGAPIPIGKAATDPSDGAVLVVKVGRALQPGTYEVTWRVVSADTHKTQGSFSFTVVP